MSENNSQFDTIPRAAVRLQLINRQHCRDFALESAANLQGPRGRRFTRVSEAFLIGCEQVLKQHIRRNVNLLPSKGKTI